MSNACNAKNRDSLDKMVKNFLDSGRVIVVAKGKQSLPKYLRYTPCTANGGNDAPGFNPLRT